MSFLSVENGRSVKKQSKKAGRSKRRKAMKRTCKAPSSPYKMWFLRLALIRRWINTVLLFYFRASR